MIASRRSVLLGLLAAPAIVRASSLMSISVLRPPDVIELLMSSDDTFELFMSDGTRIGPLPLPTVSMTVADFLRLQL